MARAAVVERVGSPSLRAARVHFAVYDLAGREVWSDEARTLEAGRRPLEWSGASRAGSSVPAGVYIARVRVDHEVLTRRVAVIR